MNQEDLHTEKIIADRKIFFLDLKENARGRVVKITEDVNHHGSRRDPRRLHRGSHRHQGDRRQSGGGIIFLNAFSSDSSNSVVLVWRVSLIKHLSK
jgi:hypothetical protein